MVALGIAGLGMWEMLLIFAAILLIFGPSRLPQLARSIGQGIRELKSGIKEGDASKVEEDENPKSPKP